MVNGVAHRGFSGRYPENTRVAFLKALRLGVDSIELDVHLTRDRELVVIHDSAVDRTTNGLGRVAQMTLSEIKALDAGSWFAAEYSGERILTLTETFEVIKGSVRLNVHVKPDDDNRQELVSLTVEELRRHDAFEYAFVASDQESVKLVPSIEPLFDVCNLSVYPTDTYIARCLAIGCRILQPRNHQVDATFVRKAHRHGIEVNPFFANDVPEMRRLIACGVDGILTDYPDLLMEMHSGS